MMRVVIYGILASLIFSMCRNESDILPSNILVNQLKNPLAIEGGVRLSWQVSASGQSRMQSAYRILVSSSLENLHKDVGDLWDSDKVSTSNSLHIPYEGDSLISRTTCYWKVKIWDESGQAGLWSEPSMWKVGLLKRTDWQAKWIGFDQALHDSSFAVKPYANGYELKRSFRPLPSPNFRKTFTIEGDINEAYVYASSLGIYELYINGQRVGQERFTPGWTDYRKRIYYNAYEVSDLLQEGENVIAATLADGWYAGIIANRGPRKYGDKLRLLAQLELNLNDGSTEFITSDDTWLASYGPIRQSDMQAGEVYDARFEMNGWTQPDFIDASWEKVIVEDSTMLRPLPYPGIPVRETKEIRPVNIMKIEADRYVVDMGQNFSGWVKLQIDQPSGDSITLRFAEAIESDTTLFTKNLRSAHCTDVYVSSGNGPVEWSPSFTYHGFRYVEVSRYSQALTPDKIVGVISHSDLERTGWFSSSDSLLNQLYRNIFWSQRSNYFDVPTDCPQRDERMGWLGDAQLFMRTASYNQDVAPFFNKWLWDVVDCQSENGRMPSTAPRVYGRTAMGWSDAVVICPWLMYEIYRDTMMLSRMYPTMVRWMDYLEESADIEKPASIDSYGDWQNAKSETPTDVISWAYYKRSAELMARASLVLGKDQQSAEYDSLAQKIAHDFNASFIDDKGEVKGNTQTAYLITLAFDLASEAQKPLVEEKLLRSIAKADSHLATGIIGTSLILPVLTEMNELGLAYHLLQNRNPPSWGNQIELGATTIWERWDGFAADSGFHSDETNSFNHYAFGSIGEWFYSSIAGIQAASPGFDSIIIKPRPGGGLTEVTAKYASVRGDISSSWKIENDSFYLEVMIPANTRANVYLPDDENVNPIAVGSGSYEFSCSFIK